MIAMPRWFFLRGKTNCRHDLLSIHESSAGHYKLQGELSFASAERALQQTASFFSAPGTVVFDLTGIAKADSAGLALLLEWRRKARKGGVDLHYVNLPGQLIALADVVGVQGILSN